MKRKFGDHFDYKIVVLSQATGTISNGNKLIDFFWQAFETWLTIGNELGPGLPVTTPLFYGQNLCQTFSIPYSTGNHSTL